MKTPHSLQFLLLLLALGLPAFAASPPGKADLPPPTEPFVAQPPSPGTWSAAAISPAKKDASPSAEEKPLPALRQLASRSSRGLEERVATYAGDLTQTLYHAGRLFIAQFAPSNDPFSFIVAQPDSHYTAIFAPGFFGCQEVSITHYKGNEVKNGILCYRYDVPVNPTPDEKFEPLPARTIWVDPSTRFPVAIQMGSDEYAFTVDTTDPGKISLPPAVKEIWARERNALIVAYGNKGVKPTPFDE